MCQCCLKINNAETEFIVLSTKDLASLLGSPSLCNGNHHISPRTPVKNIGVVFDQCMSVQAYVTSLCHIAFYQLKNIARLGSFIKNGSCETIIHAFITCELDFSHSVWCSLNRNVSSNLQPIQRPNAHMFSWNIKGIIILQKFFVNFIGYQLILEFVTRLVF